MNEFEQWRADRLAHGYREIEPDLHQPGLFPHECEMAGCHAVVQYDDEPYCFTHSPDEGSSVAGYSARRKAGGTDGRGA